MTTVSPDTAFPLAEVTVRLVTHHEVARWQALMAQHHYLGFPGFVGERLYHVAEWQGRWLALIGWTAAAYRCRARDSWIGWTDDQRRRRLRFVANNARFLILPDAHVPHLGSRVLGLALRRLSCDWQVIHGHPVVLTETFIDPSRFRGTVYWAANWQAVGTTRGFGRHHGTYQWHGQIKRVAVRPLVPRAQAWLTSAWDVPAFISGGPSIMLSTESLTTGRRSLMTRLQALADVRKPRGVRHPYGTVLTIALAGIAAGCTSLLAIGEWARGLTQEQLATLHAARFKGRYIPPSESAIRRALQRSDAAALDDILERWMAEQGVPAAIACDGKTVRGSGNATTKPRHLVSAVVHGTTRVIAQTEVDQKSNEIPAMYTMLDPLDLTGTLITADAMHTQQKFATYVVENKQADYLLIAKGNQPTLEADLRALAPEDFSPSGRHVGKRSRTSRTSAHPQ
ncbi:MAG: ISAs1 family transposase [Sulfobacillus sp.]